MARYRVKGMDCGAKALGRIPVLRLCCCVTLRSFLTTPALVFPSIKDG